MTENCNFTYDELRQNWPQDLIDPLPEGADSEKNEFVLSFGEMLVANLWELSGYRILKVISIEAWIVSYDDILVDVALHLVLQVKLNEEAVVVNVLI